MNFISLGKKSLVLRWIRVISVLFAFMLTKPQGVMPKLRSSALATSHPG